MSQNLKIALILFFLTTCLSKTSPLTKKPATLVESPFIHINAKGSPLHDPFATEDDIHKRDVEITMQRAEYLFGKKIRLTPHDKMFADAAIIDSSFILKFKIGDPPIETYGYIDSGSSLCWVQCEPCMLCTRHDGTLYDVDKSSSYGQILYEDPTCDPSNIGASTDDLRGNCSFSLRYLDMSFEAGIIGQETFTFGSVKHRLIFGCANYNVRGDYTPPGLIGLGRFPSSLVSQLSASRFMYYVRYSDFSGIFAISPPYNDRLNEIPLFPARDQKEPYTLQWRSIKVAKDRLKLADDFYATGIIIDSGSTHTALPVRAVEQLQNAIIRKMGLPLENKGSEFCYESIRKAPTISFQFVNYELKLCPINVWRPPTDTRSPYCLAIIKAPISISIFGMYQQRGMRVTYNLNRDTVSMAYDQPDCPPFG